MEDGIASRIHRHTGLGLNKCRWIANMIEKGYSLEEKISFCETNKIKTHLRIDDMFTFRTREFYCRLSITGSTGSFMIHYDGLPNVANLVKNPDSLVHPEFL